MNILFIWGTDYVARQRQAASRDERSLRARRNRIPRHMRTELSDMARHGTDASDTSDTCFALSIFIPYLCYLHNILSLLSSHYYVKNFLYNSKCPVHVSEVSSVEDCTHDLRAVSGDSRLYGEKICGLRRVQAQAACHVLSRTILLPRHPEAEVFSLLRGIFRHHSLLSQSVLPLRPASPL